MGYASPSPVPRGRLLVITSLWPTPDMPSVGIFVKQRLVGIPASVVAPHSYRGSMPLRYLRLLWEAAIAPGRFYGVEAHVLFPTGLVGWIAARIRRLPLVVYAHGADVRRTAQENPAYRYLARFVAKHADAVITNSEATAQLVRALGRDPVVIPPGVDMSRFVPSPRPGVRRVLYLGGDRPEKGYDRARPVADTLAGQRLAEVRPEDVPSLIAAHDVVLMPSRREAFGLLAAEAIASGRWVVASNVDGLREIVIDGVNGSLVDDEDFQRAVDTVPEYDPVSLAATVQQFSLESHQAQMAQVWARLAQRGARESG